MFTAVGISGYETVKLSFMEPLFYFYFHDSSMHL
jgi:hypothetical protein